MKLFPGNKMWVFLIISLVIASTLSMIPFISGSPISTEASELKTESDPYSIYGYALQYDGTSAGGYIPTALMSATITVSWINSTTAAISTKTTTSNATGQYSVDIENYTDGGIVYCNVTNNPEFENKGYNWTVINQTTYPTGRQQDIVCGVPYEVVINQPTIAANVASCQVITMEYTISDIDGVLSPGYFTHAGGDLEVFVNAIPGSSELYTAPPTKTFEGTSDPDPGHYLDDASMHIDYPLGMWFINVSEGGESPPDADTQYLTPWGEWYVDPMHTIPGYWRDFKNITLNIMSGGGFDWYLTEGWNLVSCPQKPVFKIGTNPFFDSQDALNWTNMCLLNMFGIMDPSLTILNRIGGNPSAYQTYNYSDPEALAFEIDTVHGYWVYYSLFSPVSIHFDAINATTTDGYVDVSLSSGWNLLGFQHNYTSMGWNNQPTARDFTDGTISNQLCLDRYGGFLNKIVVSRWERNTQSYQSYVATTTFLGLSQNDWDWDFSYSSMPGNGYMIWVDQPVTMTYSALFGQNPGTNPRELGGELPIATQYKEPAEDLYSISKIEKTDSTVTPHDPHPIYGYVYENLVGVGSGYDVNVEWTNEIGEISPGSPLQEVTNADSQYSVDLFDYQDGSIVWVNATGPSYEGYNATTINSSPSGGEHVDIFNIPLSPEMTVTKTAPALANPGETITYTISYLNIGIDAAYNVMITDIYSANVTFVNSNPPPTVGFDTWNIGSVLPGSGGVIFINITINPGATGILTNWVYLDYEDGIGFPLPQESDFAVTTLFSSTFVIPLHDGWNLISFPLVPVDTSVENLLSSISGNWDRVKWYDNNDHINPWKTYRAGVSTNDLTDIDNTMGFWLYVTNSADDLVIYGTEPVTTNITLEAGWNLVSYPSNTTDTVANALWGTGANRVECYDGGSPYLISEMEPTEMMMPGNGYWAYVPADTIWTVDY